METVKYFYTKPVFIFKAASFQINGFDEVSVPHQKFKEGKRMTIAGLLDPDTNQVRFGRVICHEKDRFVKKIGRELALKAAKENPFMIISHFSGDFKDFINLVRHTGHMEERKFYKKYYNNLINGII